MNADRVLGGCQPWDQASWLGLRVRRKLAATIHIRHRRCYYYSTCVCVCVRVRVRVCVCVVDAILTSLYSASSARLSAWHCLHLVLSVVLRRHAARRPCRCRMSIDISCPQTAQQQTCHTSLLWWNDGTDGQTDWQTPGRYINPARGAYSVAVPVKWSCFAATSGGGALGS